MAETRKLVDVISVFLIGSAPGIKDLIRIGKKVYQTQLQSGHKRPTLVKFCTVWNKQLILTAKAKLKHSDRQIFCEKGYGQRRAFGHFFV